MSCKLIDPQMPNRVRLPIIVQSIEDPLKFESRFLLSSSDLLLAHLLHPSFIMPMYSMPKPNEFGNLSYHPMSESENASYSQPQFPDPALARSMSNYSAIASESRLNLVERTDSQPSTQSRKRYTLPLFRGPSGFSRTEAGNPAVTPFQWRDLFKGWRLLLFGSWFNVLLCLIPVAVSTVFDETLLSTRLTVHSVSSVLLCKSTTDWYSYVLPFISL